MGRLALAISISALLAGTAPVAPASGDSPPAALEAPSRDSAQRSLRRFARGWMEKLHRAEAANRAEARRAAGGATYTGYGRGFRIEVKRTGRAEVPFVGLIRYEEHVFRCTDAAMKKCGTVSTVPVTEIFRFQDGRWVY